MQTFNVAILGFGLSGSVFHAPLIMSTPGLKLSHILSAQADRIKNKYPELTVVKELEDLLQIESIDLIINTLPNELHYSVTKSCLERGKHVIVEKPFVINSRDGYELIRIAKDNGLLLSVYHNRRYDNGYLTVQKIKDKLGEIFLYQAYYDRYRPEVNLNKWREMASDGSGILFDLGAHLLDQALNLFGKPGALFADLGKQRHNAQTIDYFELTLWYEEMRVVLGSSSIITNPRPTIAVYGDSGSYVKYGLDPQEDMLRQSILPDDIYYGAELEENAGILTIADNGNLTHNKVVSEVGNYPYFYAQVYKALAGYAQLPVSAQAGLDVILMIEAATRSHTIGQKVYLS